MIPTTPAVTPPNQNVITLLPPVSPPRLTSQTDTPLHNSTDTEATGPIIQNREVAASPWKGGEPSDDAPATAMPHSAPEFIDQMARTNSGLASTTAADSFAAIKAAALSGDTTAQFELSQRYGWGVGIEGDQAQAVFWCRKAAEQGHAGAQHNLGWRYEVGRGVEADVTQAMLWYRKAAEQSPASAQDNLGLHYDLGRGFEADQRQAVLWCRKAAEQGYAGAQFDLGSHYDFGRGVERNEKQAFLWYREAAEQGHADGQFQLGLCYNFGRGIVADQRLAVLWCRKAAEQGHALSQSQLGWCYEHGLGIEEDETQAMLWYRKAAEQSPAIYQYNLAKKYLDGKGIEPNFTEAFVWFRKAAEQGLAAAQFNLGFHFANGLGIELDDTQAVLWYRKAAEQGHTDAQYQLGLRFAGGKGVKANHGEAFIWFEKAAQNNSESAQYSLAHAYHRGLGVSKDILQATYWLLRSGLDSDGEEIDLGDSHIDDQITNGFDSNVIKCIPKVLVQYPEFKQVKFIDFGPVELNEEGFAAVGYLIRSNSRLERLGLTGHDFSQKNMEMFRESLKFNTNLIELNFEEEGIDDKIRDQIAISLAQNVVIAELRQYLKKHLATRSDYLPLEVLDIVVDQMIVSYLKGGHSKEATLAAIDEFLLSASRQTLEAELKKSS